MKHLRKSDSSVKKSTCQGGKCFELVDNVFLYNKGINISVGMNMLSKREEERRNN